MAEIKREQIMMAIEQIRTEISDIIDNEGDRQLRFAPSFTWFLDDPLGHFDRGAARKLSALIGAETAFKIILEDVDPVIPSCSQEVPGLRLEI